MSQASIWRLELGRVGVVFGCPTEFEERFGDDPGGAVNVTPDPGQVD